MRTNRLAVAMMCLALLSSFSACFTCLGIPDPSGTGGGSGSGGAFSISGQLLNGQQPGPDAQVEVRKSGVVLGSTKATSGSFSLNVDPGGPSTLLVTIKADGINPIARTVKADRVGSIKLEEQVVALQSLACTDTSCSAGGLRVDGLPAGTTGMARAFNPFTETSAFPGGFDDSDGNLLLSGAFATVELKDAQGQPLTQLTTPATLRVPFPKDTWSLMVDIAPGDGKLTVPLFYFDESLATWKREGTGELQLDDGTVVAETQLASIRGGTFGSELFVSGQVRHFSTWNVDWPISSHGCVTGRIVTAARAPLKSAKVEIEGITYTGRSPVIVTSDDGRFCADVLRSEAPGEDVDNNGVTGQAQKVGVYVSSGDEVYDGKTHVIPTAPASCGGSCLNVGDLVLDATSQYVTALCNVSGTLVDSGGAPVSGLDVLGFSTATADQVMTVCPDQSCTTLSATTGADGTFSGSVAVKDRLSLLAQRSDTPSPRTTRTEMAFLQTRACPRGPVRLQLGPPRLITELEITISGQRISWFPVVTLQTIAVQSANGDTKWAVVTAPAALVSPLTYGVNPPGAIVVPGLVGGALSSGDDIALTGTLQEGAVQHLYTGSFTVP